ncbi:MAG: tyrosine-type recombinase/integrase [bacterium]
MKFSIAAKDFLEMIEATKSNGTYDFLVRKIASLKKYFENVELENIDKKMIVKYINFYKKKNPEISHVTINRNIAVLNRILDYNDYNKVNFDKLPENKTIKDSIPDFIVVEVLNDLEERSSKSPEAYRNYVFFRLLLDTGIRVTEALNLRIQDFDFENRLIHLKVTKSKRERFVMFTQSTRNLLEHFIMAHNLNDYIFMNYYHNKRLKVDNIQKLCYRMKRRLNLEVSITPHAWRHTFANRFLKNGGNLETLRLIMGHASLKTTQIYLHLDKNIS